MEELSISHYCVAEIGDRFGGVMEANMEFLFDKRNPLMVEMRFYEPDNSGSIDWVISRDLLEQGTNEACGHGDIQLWPVDTAKTRLAMVLKASDEFEEDGSLTVSMREVKQFLRRTRELLPKAAEEEIVQAELESFLYELLEEK